ncbi:uncharacterized protein FOMMEDRAFT_145041 [Fomitiporia mediterranea MF3/22]|uniref:uncharacterized protein n=1 Tax=Fomitiporia mediterranea (strain MF3/22) TaxID=694068 RepID=UPI000440990A|nr:uncharacterized protein FOMMEDRAFT_145041 [Fomitiporia mediterranea MF3/22]EJD05532.1 hypothetical protein FOMMEDRAFT_145041 [Fomitiporia mediterranea MF3/22]
MAQVLQSTLSSFQNLLSWTNNPCTESTSSTSPQQIKLPDLIAAFPDAARGFRINSLCKEISDASDEWAVEVIGKSDTRVKKATSVNNSRVVLPEQHSGATNAEGSQDETLDLKMGLLASMCFPFVDRTQLRICSDLVVWIGLLEHHLACCTLEAALDCIHQCRILAENEPGFSDIIDTGLPKGLQSILKRLERSPQSNYVYDRVRLAVHAYLKRLALQLSEPTRAILQNLKSYVAEQRIAGWHTLLFILIEFAHGLEKLQSVLQNNAAVRSVGDAAADAIVYALDIFACVGVFGQAGAPILSNTNSVTILAHEQKVDLSRAIERVGSFCADRLREFSSFQTALLQESSKSGDLETEIYVRGLGHCIRGVLYWVFESERYFGRDGGYIRMTLVVERESSTRNDELEGGDLEE